MSQITELRSDETDAVVGGKRFETATMAASTIQVDMSVYNTALASPSINPASVANPQPVNIKR
jgi:hypothetical protein